MTLADGRPLVLGIRRGTNTYSGMGEVYNPSTGTWSLTATSPFLCAGGDISGQMPPVPPPNSLGCAKYSELYDPEVNAFRRIADMNWFREYHAVTLLVPDGRVPGRANERRHRRGSYRRIAIRRGMTVAEAAARFSVTTRNVYAACREHGVRFGVSGVGRSARIAKRDRAIARAAKGGEPAASIAERLSLPEATVRSACERQGVRPVPGTESRHARSLAVRRGLRKRAKALLRSATPRTREIVRLMLATDWTMARIAGECGVSGQRVNEVWRRAVRNSRLSAQELAHSLVQKDNRDGRSASTRGCDWRSEVDATEVESCASEGRERRDTGLRRRLC